MSAQTQEASSAKGTAVTGHVYHHTTACLNRAPASDYGYTTWVGPRQYFLHDVTKART